MPLSVVVVDDHAGFRRAARAFLELEGFAVVGEASDGQAALTLTQELRPQLVLLDVALPDASGFDIARQLAADCSNVILTSTREHDDLGRRVRESGALGFIPKDQLSGPAVHALLGRL